MRYPILFAACFLALAVPCLGAAATDSIRVSLDFDSPVVTSAAGGLVDVSVSGLPLADDPAWPRLPRDVLVYALPPDAIPSSVSVVVDVAQTEDQSIDGLVRPAPARIASEKLPPAYGLAKKVAGGKDASVYETDAFFPASAVALDALPQMRRWKMARVVVSPVLYNPVAGTLRSARHLEFSIQFKRTGAAQAALRKSERFVDGDALKMVANGTDAAAWYGAGSTPVASGGAGPSSGNTYLIMTTDEILGKSSDLFGFIPHKQAMGWTVHTVTETAVDGSPSATGWNEVTGQAPNGKADRMRKWLQNNYVSLGVQYVLLVGNPTANGGSLPMKVCDPMGTNDYYDYPNDVYYSDLTGNWDLDGDGLYGEEPDDCYPGGVDFAGEVLVGRIPVYETVTNWPTALRSILQKTIRYETEPSIEWRKRALLPESWSDYVTDGAWLGENMRTNFLLAKGYSTWTMYQQGSADTNYDSTFASDEELRPNRVVNRWQTNDYGVCCWWAHGWSRGAAIMGDGYLFETEQAAALDDEHPSVSFLVSCDCAFPEDQDNLAYAFVRHGGIACVAACNVSWYYYCSWSTNESKGMNASMGYDFTREVVDRESTFGQAMENVRTGGADWRNNLFTFNLYGDPSLKITSHGADADSDGMPDAWETAHGLSPADPADATADPDGDGYPNWREFRNGTEPRTNDLPRSDYSTIDLVGTFNGWSTTAHPMMRAGNYDWVLDLTVTNLSAVEFKFCANSSWAINWGDPYQPAQAVPMRGVMDLGYPDNILVDGTLNGTYRFTFNEITLGFTVQGAPQPDTDGDGIPDAWELAHGLNPNLPSDAAADPDHDGLTNGQEYERGSDPQAWTARLAAYRIVGVAGTFNGWNPAATNMALVADHTWRADLSIAAADAEFKFTAGATWATNWGDANQSSSNAPFSGVGDWFGPNIHVNGPLNGTYRFTFNDLTQSYGFEQVAAADTDGDSMPDAWEIGWGLNRLDGSDANGDPDGDGLVNFDENLLGGSPLSGDTDGDGAGDWAEAIAGTGVSNPASLLEATETATATNFTLAWPGAAGRSYDIFVRTNLVSGSWQPVAGCTNLSGSAGTMSVNLGTSQGACFRVKVRKN